MKLFKLITAGLLLPFGILMTIVVLVELSNPKNSYDDKVGAAIGGFFVGGIPLVMGGGLAWSLYQDRKKALEEKVQQEQERIRAIFYQLLQENEGKVTAIRLAMNAQLSADEAKKFLDQQAVEFNATFDIDEQGESSYHFKI